MSENYRANEEEIYQTVEIAGDEFKNMIKNLGLMVITDSFYVNINELPLFIRKEDFKYTVIINKNAHNISDETLDSFHLPGLLFADENYVYYSKIDRKNLLQWAKNAA